MNLELTSEFLKTPCRALDYEQEREYIFDLTLAMVDFMKKNTALGLSANQVGHPVQLFVFGDPKTESSIKAVINPRVVFQKDEYEYLVEGCLSYPGYFVKVKRPKQIRVRYQNLEGKIESHTYIGMTCRIFMHEFSHLQGLTIKDQATRFHKNQALKRSRKSHEQTL